MEGKYMKLEQVEKCCSGQVLGGEFMLYPEEEKKNPWWERGFKIGVLMNLTLWYLIILWRRDKGIQKILIVNMASVYNIFNCVLHISDFSGPLSFVK